MPSDLPEIFGAVTVGLLALTVLSMVRWWSARSAKTCLQYWWKSIRRLSPGVMAILFPFVFGFGLVVQDLTDNLTDSEYRERFYPADKQHDILRSEGTHRLKVLFSDKRPTGLWQNMSSSRKYMSRTLGSTHPEQHGKVEMFLHDPMAFIRSDRDGAERFASTLYYEAKNWAYAQDNYFDELESIQRRIDFSRSAFLVATWGIVGHWFVALIGFPVWWWRDRTMRRRTGRSRPAGVGYLVSLRRLLGVTLLLFIVAVFSCMGYDKSEVNFNERAFGYFYSHLRASDAPDTDSANPGLNANLWMQTAGEYDAITRQTFRAALAAAREHVCGPGVSTRDCKAPIGPDGWRRSPDGRPYAFVMDLDETILDNAVYQSLLILTGREHKSEYWNMWVRGGIADVGMVPGADAFLNGLKELGVAAVFISNRPESERQATIDALTRLGIAQADPGERLLLQTSSSSKDDRRAVVQGKYEVVGFIGDDLGDFIDILNDVATAEERKRMVTEFEAKWGTEWFALPNPVYGSWQRHVSKEPREQFLRTLRSPGADSSRN